MIGLSENFKNKLFCFLTFCFHEATLEADLARYKCAMDMVDGALKRSDVDGCERGIAWSSPLLCVRNLGSKLGNTPVISCFSFSKKTLVHTSKLHF